jgi:adenylate kinase family enzyme
MRRIVVVGGAGSGKTRLSLALGRKLGLPVIHGDVLYWLPGWQPSAVGDLRARVSQAIAGDGWVFDGSFSGLALDLTVARADLFIWIERPRALRMWRVLLRSIFERDQTRPDLPVGCPEVLDWPLVKEAWLYDSVRVPNIEAERQQYGPDVPVVRLRSDREIEAFLDEIPVSSPAIR